MFVNRDTPGAAGSVMTQGQRWVHVAPAVPNPVRQTVPLITPTHPSPELSHLDCGCSVTEPMLMVCSADRAHGLPKLNRWPAIAALQQPEQALARREDWYVGMRR